MSFGTTNDRTGRKSGKLKKPKPRKGQEPATLAECEPGDVVSIRVRVFAWVGSNGAVRCRPIADGGAELQPIVPCGETKVSR